MVKPYVPERGDIVWLDFSPTVGHEQKGKRPAIVITPSSYNKKTFMAIVCPITTKTKGYPFEVTINSSSVNGFALVDQLKAIDWHAKKIEYSCKTSNSELNKILNMINLLLC